MKWEAIKSILLAILILFSILFTFGIWNYQPDYESIGSTESDYTDPQLNGIEQTKSQVIEPVKTIFHFNNQHFRLRDQEMKDNLFSEIQSLSLLDFEAVSAAEDVSQRERVVFHFPVSLPATVLSDLFTIEEDNIPTGGSFSKFSIALSSEGQLSQVEFIDTESNQKFIARLRREEVERIMNSYLSEENLEEQTVFYGKDDIPIYLPAEEPEIYERVYPVNSFSEESELDPLIDALFSDPTVVLQNQIPGGEQYTDAKRDLRVYGSYMEYYNPTAEYTEMDSWNLINQSLNFVNGHHGWTAIGEDEYQLYNMNTRRNTITYRMTYQEYPVFDKYNHLDTITVTIHNNSVYEYSRPLIQLGDPFAPGKESASVGSGERAISLIEQNKELSINTIEDIVLGYKLVNQQATVKLVPAWYYKNNSGWREIPVPEVANGGGS